MPPTGFRQESARNPHGLRTPRARAHSTATYTATSKARILYLTGAAPRPVDNLAALPLAAMRARGSSCQ